MNRVFKWVGVGILGLVALAGLGMGAVYALAEREIRRQYDVPLANIVVPHDAESIAKGKRLATIYGCFNSCHGDRMQGLTLVDEPGIARINAPNLTRVVREYTDAQLERLIRHGVKRDGTSTWLMPSPMFSHMSDEDLGDVIAFVRSSPVLDGPMREVNVRMLGRIGIVTGKFKPLASTIARGEHHPATTDRSDPLTFGRYVVMTTCTECHGQDLQGTDFAKAPSLVVTAGYSEAAFRHLMKTGIGIGDRKLGLMAEVSETRFANFTEEELQAVQTYLGTRFGNLALAGAADAGKPTAARVTPEAGDRS
ncbi:MAG TPA: cytochrome c [Steroidobacteraceae bacterium]|nr:cytochrome c [Steroidobacteraceae bacterium]